MTSENSGPPKLELVSEQDIDLRKLRYFLAVAAESNFGRAAARLHMISPPERQTVWRRRSASAVEVTGRCGGEMRGGERRSA